MGAPCDRGLCGTLISGEARSWETACPPACGRRADGSLAPVVKGGESGAGWHGGAARVGSPAAETARPDRTRAVHGLAAAAFVVAEVPSELMMGIGPTELSTSK